MSDTITPRRYGWRPSLPDPRDLVAFDRPIPASIGLPDTFSLRESMPPVYDQGNLGSCTANAIAAAYEFDMMDAGEDAWTPSRLFIYYCERVREGTVKQDSGAMGRSGFASLRKTGVCPEEMLPYDIDRFTEKPTEECYMEAAKHKIKNYVHPVRGQQELRALILNRQPVAFGFTVFESFEAPESMRSGLMPMPKPQERSLGGHEVLAVGWDAYGIECRNSWGPDVMDEGYFWMPYDYFRTGYCSDFRAISQA